MLGRNRKARVKTGWRKPMGIDNKVKRNLKAYGVSPDIGYRTPKKERNKHPSGLPEVLVSNEKQLSSLEPSKVCIRFSASLGKKKKIMLIKICNEKKFKMVN